MKKFVAAGTCVGLGFVSYKVSQDNGVQRSLQFWKEVAPIYAEYRMVQFRNETLGTLDDVAAMREYGELHRKHSEQVKNTTYKMGGFYLKSAQLMSVLDDFIPPEYMSWVKDTQDNVPSAFKDATEVRNYVSKVLQDELRMEFDDVFSSFDDEPLGVASIGQVHRAVLRKTGQVVAVKIQMPDIEACFRSDIATITNFCQLALPQFVPTFAEIEKQFCTEFDYKGEAKNLNTIRDLVLPNWGHVISIPKPHMNLCSQRILVMEYLEGVKLVDGIRNQYQKVADATGQSLEAIEKERADAVESGMFMFQSLEESRREHQSVLSRLYWMDMVTSLNSLRLINNWTPLRLVFGHKKLHETPAPLDLAYIMQLLSDVHAYEVFQCGCFNGDPHPGNIMLLKDGKIGLIDYGQVKSLEEKHRILYAKFILALSRGDREEIVRLYNKEMDIRTKNNLEEVLFRHAVFYHDYNAPEIMQGLNVHLFLEKLENDDPVQNISEEYVMVGRVNMLIRGLSKAFGLELRMSDLWKGQAEEYLRSKKEL